MTPHNKFFFFISLDSVCAAALVWHVVAGNVIYFTFNYKRQFWKETKRQPKCVFSDGCCLLMKDVLAVRWQPSCLEASGIYRSLFACTFRYVTCACEFFILQSPWNQVDNGKNLRGLWMERLAGLMVNSRAERTKTLQQWQNNVVPKV